MYRRICKIFVAVSATPTALLAIREIEEVFADDEVLKKRERLS